MTPEELTKQIELIDEKIDRVRQTNVNLEAENSKLRQDLDNVLNFTQNLGGSLEFRRIVETYGRVKELTVSSKGSDTEDQSVNEAGSSTYNVLKEPDGFLEVEIEGVTYYLPYYG